MPTGCQGISAVAGLAHQRIHSPRRAEPAQEVVLQEQERTLGRARGLLHQPAGRGAPQSGEVQALVDEVAQRSGQRRCGSRPEPHPDERGAGRDDLDVRTGERAEQLRAAAEREVDLDPAGGQVPLHVRRVAGALDPDRAHHSGQRRQRRPLDVRLPHGHLRSQPRGRERRQGTALEARSSRSGHRTGRDDRTDQVPGRFPVGMVIGVVVADVPLFRNSIAIARMNWSNM
nr:hypothetical protein [Amycolatopsis sp. ATCC 39116]